MSHINSPCLEESHELSAFAGPDARDPVSPAGGGPVLGRVTDADPADGRDEGYVLYLPTHLALPGLTAGSQGLSDYRAAYTI